MLTKDILKKIEIALDLTFLQPTKKGGGGCINEGVIYNSNIGELFLKQNSKQGSKLMFEGELESLRAIHKTEAIRVPKPLALVEDEKSCSSTVVLVMEALDMKGGAAGAQLGSQLADLHLHNLMLRDPAGASRVSASSEEAGHGTDIVYENRFGFSVPTCCGFIPQDNEWCDDWQVFFARKLDFQIKKLQTESSGRSVREAVELWPRLQRAVPRLFEGASDVAPSLLHGDLWGGNAATVQEHGASIPVVFDPASFYGHHEYDLAIAAMFGGFSKEFFSSYFEKLPKAAGWESRHQLYQLFHYLNHWNHFGSSYSSSSLHIMKTLAK